MSLLRVLGIPCLNSHSLLAWSNISEHALNTAFCLVEILLTHAGPTPWLHIPFLILILAGYLGIAYITHATQGFYSTYSSCSISTSSTFHVPWVHLHSNLSLLSMFSCEPPLTPFVHSLLLPQSPHGRRQASWMDCRYRRWRCRHLHYHKVPLCAP